MDRTLYILFLRYPDGINADELWRYWDELCDIYGPQTVYDDIKMIEDVEESTIYRCNPLWHKCTLFLQSKDITMGLLDFLFGDDNSSNNGRDYDRSVFDTDRFRNNGSGNWVDWEDVSTGRYDGDGFEHPSYDEDGEW